MKRKDFDVVGILLGIVVGILIGYFISTRIDLNNETIEVNSELEEPAGYIYLLQIAKFDNPEGSLKYLESLEQKELEATVVFDKTYYYIYGGISTSSLDLEDIRSKYESRGYTTLIKKEYILDKPNSILDSKVEYDFWLECINNLLASLDDKEIVINEKYYLNPIDLEAFSNMTILQSLRNDDLKNKVRLQLYKNIIESLA